MDSKQDWIERTKQDRKRWMRWLGQVTRTDRATWVQLVDTNWQGWADSVIDNHNIDLASFDSFHAGLVEIKKYYQTAIRNATFLELQKLDNIYCQEYLC